MEPLLTFNVTNTAKKHSKMEVLILRKKWMKLEMTNCENDLVV
jgi:hypothetical protein